MDAGVVQEIEVVGLFGVALRGEASNRAALAKDRRGERRGKAHVMQRRREARWPGESEREPVERRKSCGVSTDAALAGGPARSSGEAAERYSIRDRELGLARPGRDGIRTSPAPPAAWPWRSTPKPPLCAAI